MDWYLAEGDPAGLRELRHQIREYLARHGEPGADIDSAVLVAHELIANATEHTVGPTWIRLSWRTREPVVEVWDLGSATSIIDEADAAPVAVEDIDLSATASAPFEPALPATDLPHGRGLFLVSHLADDLEIVARRGGGTRVVARLPVARAAAHPGAVRAPLTSTPLPDLDEADAGAFGKEAFLRALVVQLSQSVEHTAGPEVSEDAVTQVGLTVGGQMEAAYRRAQAIVDRLSPEQLADCYVKLKHEIGGRFRVVEVDDSHIVLENTRCPFGNAVRKSPALCRMTSSVFGGIAARNRDDGAAVVLEERIAIGDPGCRVIVHLGEPPAGSARFAHRYPSSPAG
jgi:anti-sigma regulatory factor (Ser/Thr protein kinase)/predicted ArsR family transcriptional regulator